MSSSVRATYIYIYTYISFSVRATFIYVKYAEYLTRELYIKHDPHKKRHTQETKRHTQETAKHEQICSCLLMCTRKKESPMHIMSNNLRCIFDIDECA